MPQRHRISLLPCNFIAPNHRTAFVNLLLAYMTDPMGGCAPHTEQTAQQVIESLRNHPTAYIQFAMYRRKIVGMAVCFVNYSTFQASPFINIHDLIVLPQFRKTGIGEALIHGVTLKAMSLQCAKVTLEVRDDNHVAKTLYRKMGFCSCTPMMEYLNKKIAVPPQESLPNPIAHKVSKM
ncbi:MAG: GNAT family N-acetyltransferase [Deltaproteobacteria bacterium]|nr:GNAT family N-acetyltransferase [Deltaproteobacteria bacterium]MBN2671355.1 GNAT family N-acetyltransferase [Deltaproteobacteria bacterium]